MDRFERLLDGDATDFERTLLDSAEDDVPSPRARAQTLAALGVGGAVLGGGTGVAKAATQVATSAAGAASPSGTTAVSLAAVLKWIGAGALAGSVVAGGLATVTSGVATSKRTEDSAVTRPTAVTPASPVDSWRPRVTPSPDPDRPVKPAAEPDLARRPASLPPSRPERVVALPSAPASPVSAPPVALTASPEPPPAAAADVTAEVDSLDRARAALAAGDARGALSRLAGHDARFPSGVLQPEAVLLRVRALLALGDRASANAVATRFITAHPDSAQASRLRMLIELH